MVGKLNRSPFVALILSFLNFKNHASHQYCRELRHPFVTSLERFQLQMWHKNWQTPKPDQTSMQKKSEYILDKAKPLMGHINRSIKMHIKVSNINFIANFSSKCYVSKQYTYERLEADWSPLLPSIPPSKKEDCDHAVILTQRSCFIHRCYENPCES